MLRKGICFLFAMIAILGCSNKEKSTSPPEKLQADVNTQSNQDHNAETKDKKDKKPPSIEDAMSALPSLPKAFFEKTLAWPTSLATLQALYGPGDNLASPDADYVQYVWRDRTINGCKTARVDYFSPKPAPATNTEETHKSPTEQYSLTFRMGECPLAVIDLMNVLGSPASPSGASDMFWLYQEARVELDSNLSMQIIPYIPSDIERLNKKDRLSQYLRAMQQPVEQVNLDIADPQNRIDLKKFTKALGMQSIRLLPAVAYPFSADGKIIQTIDDGKKILKSFNMDKMKQVNGDMDRIDTCEVTTYEKLLAGEPFREDRPLERSEAALKQNFRRIPGVFESGDALVNCYTKGKTWEGVFFSYRKVGNLWRPSGYLD